MIFAQYNLRMIFSNRAPLAGNLHMSIKLEVPEEIGDKVLPSTSRKRRNASPPKTCENWERLNCFSRGEQMPPRKFAWHYFRRSYQEQNAISISCLASRKKKKPRNEFVSRIISVWIKMYSLRFSFSRRRIPFHFFWSNKNYISTEHLLSNCIASLQKRRTDRKSVV